MWKRLSLGATLCALVLLASAAQVRAPAAGDALREAKDSTGAKASADAKDSAAAKASAGAKGSADALTPLTSEPAVVWSFGPLAFEREPLAAGAYVIASGRDPTGRRALVVLDAESGRMLSRTLFPSTVPLEVAFANERVAVRSSPTRLDIYRLRGGRLFLERTFQGTSLSAPVFDGTELYLREGDQLARYDMGRREPVWRAQAPGVFRGTPALRGSHVFAAWYDTSGVAHVVCVERTSGQVLADTQLGRHRANTIPDDSAELTLAVHAHAVFVHLPLPVPSTSGTEFDWARTLLDGARFSGPITLHAFLAEPLETAGGFIVPERTPDGARWLALERDDDGRERAVELASSAHHAWLTQTIAPASRAGEVLYLGPAGVEQDSYSVLWKRAETPRFRAVPLPDDADGGLLVVVGDLLRRLGPPPSPPDAARAKALALVADGEHSLGERLAPLASQAVRAGDAELATRLVADATDLGASGRALTVARADLEHVAPNTTPDPRKRAAVLAAEDAARATLPETLARSARSATDLREKCALLAELFRRAPESEAGLETLGTLVPPGAALAGGAPAAWLDYLAVESVLPIELLTAPESTNSKESARLLEQRTSWRPDVLGYESARLFVATAATSPGAVARALRAGELVCDVLASTFGGDRGGAQRLELVLYPTRAEYLAHSGGDLGGLESALGWTAGHYDLAADVSRIFLPEHDQHDARLLGVYAHELTHHWLASRSRFGPLRALPTTAGFWIVEAIATWTEELELDVERHTWKSALARSPSLDTLAAAHATDLIPWRKFLGASFDEYRELEQRPTCTLSLAWQLGATAPRGPMQLFYAQGGALAQYLFEAENGRFRELLLHAVEAYYRGTPMDVCAALGVSPEDLGARVQEFAHDMVK